MTSVSSSTIEKQQPGAPSLHADKIPEEEGMELEHAPSVSEIIPRRESNYYNEQPHAASIGPKFGALSRFSASRQADTNSNSMGPLDSVDRDTTTSISSSRRDKSRLSIFRDISFLQRDSNAAVPVGTPISCQGYLTKRGHLVTNWKTRYFVLRGNILTYYADEESSKSGAKPLGQVQLVRVAPWSGESHGFMFFTEKKITYLVRASSEIEQKKWMEALKSFIVQPDPVDCEGYLTKRGHLVPSWRMRYFVLRGTSLKYFYDIEGYHSSASAMGEVEVATVAIWEGKDTGIMFRTSTGNMFYVFADTVDDQKRWLAALKKVVSIPEPVSCAGYLTKQGHKRKSWKKRYFALRGSSVLYYTDYDAANNASKPLGQVVVDYVQTWDGEPFGFMFMTADQVPYYVYADNDRERQKWISALRKNTGAIEESSKACPRCSAQLTGTRFCGACGYKIRSSMADESSGYSPKSPGAVPITAVAEGNEEIDEDTDNTPFDELEALSEGARTLLLAVMQTPEGVDIGDTTRFPPRFSQRAARISEGNEDSITSSSTAQEGNDDSSSSGIASAASSLEAVGLAKSLKSRSPVGGELDLVEQRKSSRITSDQVKRRASSPATSYTSPVELPLSKSVATPPKKEMVHTVLEPPVAAPKKSSATSSTTVSPAAGSTLTPTSTPTNRSPERVHTASQDTATLPAQEVQSEDEEVDDQSFASIKLDTRGVFDLDEPAKVPPKEESRATAGKKDLYQIMEKELEFIQLYLPSLSAPVRCRFYGSMNYSSAQRIVIFIADSGPLGLWRQDQALQSPSVDHPWSMMKYLTRAFEEGYGVIVSNPFSNNVKVFEEGGRERIVPIPGSSTPKEHVEQVWENYAAKCNGTVSIIAYARGGALVKALLQSHEASMRNKLHRIAFIESRHVIDGEETGGVIELLGRRTINWEASSDALGAQVVASQVRVGCVCLSLGIEAIHGAPLPVTLDQALEPVYSFLGANPDRPGMTAVVQHVRAALRANMRRKSANNGKGRSGVVVLGETSSNPSTTSSDSTQLDSSAGTVRRVQASPLNEILEEKSSDDVPPRPNPYYVPQKRGSATQGAKHKSGITSKDFELLKVVGQGGFGKVLLAKKITEPNGGRYFAMKILKKNHVLASGLVNTTMAERHILTEISHPFIVKLHYAFQTDSKLYLVMDYLSGGSLSAHLRRRRKFSEEWARFYAAEVAAAIAHLHSVNIIYRDAKLENVLMDHVGHVRITDFGLSKVGVSGLQGATTFCGTAAYIAPELLKGNAYGKAADWWSFGILLYEMIAGKPPYYHRNRDIMFQTILKQEWVTFSPAFSDSAVSLIRGLLIRDPMKRLGSGPRGADEILTHPFFDSIDWSRLLAKEIPPPFNPGVGEIDTAYVPRNLQDVIPRDRENSVTTPPVDNDLFDGFSFVGRPVGLDNAVAAASSSGTKG